MAQQRSRRTGAGARLARRLGAGGRAAAAALVALVVGLGAFAVARGVRGGAFEIERAVPAREEAAPAGESVGDEGAGEPEAAEGANAPEEAPATVFVHVDGAVTAPGVYELPEGARAVDAIAAAGGLAEGADTTPLNLAAPLTDGEKIHVPAEGEASAPAVAPGGGAAGAGAPAGAEAGAAPVNLNTATAEELCTLPGVGEATAEAIIRDREANGPFSAPEDLMRVSGIGEKKFAKLEGRICV